MADVKMPNTKPCQFDEGGWRPCKKPSDNGWCSEHENLSCVSCGKKAVRSCDAGMGGLVCGAPLCADCKHDNETNGHVTKEVADAVREAERQEEEARIASRTSPVRRMNEQLGVPKTLSELLKGDWRSEGWELKKAYNLELKHGLMGFFPAIFSGNRDRIVVTTDLRLMERVWRMLEPRDATLGEGVAYVNEELSIAFFETNHPAEREDRVPIRMITTAELESLTKEEKPFRWAPGLIGGHNPDLERFRKSLVDQAAKFDPSFSSAA